MPRAIRDITFHDKCLAKCLLTVRFITFQSYFFPLVYMATFDGEGVEDILQPKGLLEGDRGYKRT